MYGGGVELGVVYVGLEWMVMVINVILINRNKLLNWLLVSISIYIIVFWGGEGW